MHVNVNKFIMRVWYIRNGCHAKFLKDISNEPV